MAKKNPATVTDFKQFQKEYRSIARIKANERKEAIGLLTPQLIREYAKGGKKAGTNLILFDRSGREHVYSPADINQFAGALKKSQKKYQSKKQGAPIAQLLGKSLAARKVSAGRIGRSTLYSTKGNLFYFRVPSDPGTRSRETHYSVIIRLDNWGDYLHSTDAYKIAVRAVIAGNVSYECSCPNHQYQYRYLATVNNCAIKPEEKDFPKITNPGLEGSCCKHVIKTLHTILKSPSVHLLLEKQMKAQSQAVGFSGDQEKFLKRADLEVAKKVKPNRVSNDEIDRAYREHKAAIKAFAKKKRDPATRQKVKDIKKNNIEMRAENRALKAKAKHDKKRAEEAKKQLQRDSLLRNLGTTLALVKKHNLPRDSVIADFAKDNSMSVQNVEDMAKAAKIG